MEKTVLNGSIEDGTELINVENLKNILKNIAMGHVQEISRETKTVINKREFNIAKVAQEVISQKPFDGFDPISFDEEIKNLETSAQEIIDLTVLVKDRGIKELVPLCYEVLSLIFVSTNEKFRQLFFHELIEYYYQKLCKNIKTLCPTNVVLREDFDQQVKVFLPIVKLETAHKLRNNKDSDSQILLEEITSNITFFFKYPRLNQEDIYAVVNNKLGSKDYNLISYETTAIGARNGHLGDYFNLKINIYFQDSEKVLNLFAKFLTPKLEHMKDLVRSGPSKKEEFFYMNYLPLLEKHGLHSLLDFSPRCYLSRLNDVLVLDDMVSLGFTALTPNIKVQFDGLMFVVKQIARFHSCSMILEEMLSQKEGRKVTLDEIYGEYLKEVIFNSEDKPLKESFDLALKSIHYLVTKFPELCKKFSHEEITKKINEGWSLLFEKVKKSEKFKNTICHGDMYVGNMLFKFDSNGVCHDATLVDFQILRYCPSVQDLLFFIYQNSYKETRDKHFRELVDGYYLELQRNLQSFNLDIATIYPREEFEESLKFMRSQAVFQALFYSPFNSIDPKVREDIMQDMEMAKKMFTDETYLIDFGFEYDEYRKLMAGLIQDLIELCEDGLL